ncbi:TIM barrel protein [Acidobacteria bacterium AH-259-A15]|nr:TIM barrel protein [Acidobacteria bacterium AH-259-A15]
MLEKRNYHLRYAPSLALLGKELTIDRRLEKFVRHGFDATEYSCAGQPNCGLMRHPLSKVEEMRKKLDLLGMEMGVFVVNPGAFNHNGGLCDSAERQTFLAELHKAIKYHQVIGNHFCTVLVGSEKGGMSRDQQRKNVIEGLTRAAEILESTDLTIVVEPINLIDRPDSFLVRSDEAAGIITEIESSHVRILFDIHHQRLSEGNLIGNIRKHHAYIGYYQAADVPGRKEPGTGEINWRSVFKAIYETGYRGFVGMEHGLSTPGEVGLEKCFEAYRQADAW